MLHLVGNPLDSMGLVFKDLSDSLEREGVDDAGKLPEVAGKSSKTVLRKFERVSEVSPGSSLLLVGPKIVDERAEERGDIGLVLLVEHVVYCCAVFFFKGVVKELGEGDLVGFGLKRNTRIFRGTFVGLGGLSFCCFFCCLW